MDIVSFHHAAHSFEIRYQSGRKLYVAHFNDPAEAISVAAQHGLISGADADALNSSNVRPDKWAKATERRTEEELLRIGFRTAN